MQLNLIHCTIFECCLLIVFVQDVIYEYNILHIYQEASYQDKNRSFRQKILKSFYCLLFLIVYVMVVIISICNLVNYNWLIT